MPLLAPIWNALRIPKWRQVEDTCVFKHTGKAGEDKNGNATFAMKLDETKCERSCE